MIDHDLNITLSFSYQRWLNDPSTCVVWRIDGSGQVLDKDTAAASAGIAEGFAEVVKDRFRESSGTSRYILARGEHQ
jgi:hypothetical protein